MKKFAKNLAEKVYKYFGENSGNMLLITSIIGIGMSSLAQTGAIILNKQYTTSQKAFMIPQELVEGMITVFSIFMITKPLQNLTKKYVNSGKLLTKELAEYMNKNNLMSKRGNPDFDFTKSVKEIISKIETSDKFIKSGQLEKESMLAEHKQALNRFEITSDAASAIAATTGGVLSTALIAPVLRNQAASSYQSININLLNNVAEKKKQAANPTFKSRFFSPNYGLKI